LLLFRHTGLPGALAWVTGMVLLAGRVAGGRARGVPRVMGVATLAVAIGTAATLGLLLVAQVVDTSGRVVVPVGGMVVTGAMQGASMTLQRMSDEAVTGRRAVEARLALGLAGSAAFAPHLRTSLRAALIPAIDATKVVGLISLPGATVGLLLAGVDPLTAIRYQVVVMYMLLGAAAVAAVVAARLGVRAMFDDAHRLVVA
jgi:putative ABC transport system permease protein